MPDPTADDLALDLPAMLRACLDRIRCGWHDLPMFASAPLTIAALCRRCLAAEAERDLLREVLLTVWEAANEDLRQGFRDVARNALHQIEAEARQALASSGITVGG